MDEISEIITKPKLKDFSDDCLLYRLAHNTYKKGDRYNAAVFNPDPTGLSTDWNKYTTPEGSLIRVGISYKPNTTKFKDPDLFEVLKLKVSEVWSIDAINSILHTPITVGGIGRPENQSHCSVYYMDEEVRLKLAGIANIISDVNRNLINTTIAEIKTSIVET
jgi:hypothetical protein